MFCSYCGKKLRDDSEFCEYCGKRITAKREPNRETPVQKQSTTVSLKKKKKPIWLWLLLPVVILLAVLIGVIVYSRSPGRLLSKQLSLGERYLSELKYEEAVAAFQAAIDIDPKNAEAYLGLAKAYTGLGDYEAAMETCQEGYRKTGDDRLLDQQDQLTESVEMQTEEEVPEKADQKTEQKTETKAEPKTEPKPEPKPEEPAVPDQPSQEDLYAAAQDLCASGVAEKRAQEDMNGDGREDLIVESGRSTGDGWMQYFVCTDGENTFTFGEHEGSLIYVDATRTNLIPDGRGGYYFAVTNSERPAALGGFMPYSAIYRISDNGAELLYEQELCMLSNPGENSIRADYTLLLGGEEVVASSVLTIDNSGRVKGNLVLDPATETYSPAN